MGKNGPYAGLIQYYTDAERRKAAAQGNVPGLGGATAGGGRYLNQGAVDQITSSLARNVAPLYPQTINSYTGAYGSEQNALSNNIRDITSGIGPYQSQSAYALGNIPRLAEGVVDSNSAAAQGAGSAINSLIQPFTSATQNNNNATQALLDYLKKTPTYGTVA